MSTPRLSERLVYVQIERQSRPRWRPESRTRSWPRRRVPGAGSHPHRSTPASIASSSAWRLPAPSSPVKGECTSPTVCTWSSPSSRARAWWTALTEAAPYPAPTFTWLRTAVTPRTSSISMRGRSPVDGVVVGDTSTFGCLDPRVDGAPQIAGRVRNQVGRERLVQVRMGLGHCGQQAANRPSHGPPRRVGTHGRVRIADCSNATVNKIDVYVSAVG